MSKGDLTKDKMSNKSVQIKKMKTHAKINQRARQ